jgi:hypothetical protein
MSKFPLPFFVCLNCEPFTFRLYPFTFLIAFGKRVNNVSCSVANGNRRFQGHS